MKLEQFYIERYRVLEDLDIRFDRVPSPLREDQNSYALDFLVGVNGTGKSTVLRLLGRIFSQLHTEEGQKYYFDVPITLSYTVGDADDATKIVLSNRRDELQWTEEPNPPLHYRFDGGDWINGAQQPLDAARYLSPLVVYSTGDLQDWQRLLRIENRTNSENENGNTTEDSLVHQYEWSGHRIRAADSELPRAVRLIEPRHLPLVALCGLVADRWEESTSGKLSYVLKELQIEQLVGFSLQIRYLEGLHDPQSVRDLIDTLAPIATRVIRQGSDWLLVFELDDQFLGSEQRFGRVYERPIQLFNALFRLTLHEGEIGSALQDVSLFLRKTPKRDPEAENAEAPMLHLYRWLSDGERSLLARMALFSLFRVNNYLILLDEPEVHFNDVWKRELINVLDQVMSGYRSHTLITTHSSIALTDVPRASIRVMQRNGDTTSGVPNQPVIETFGADPSDILVHVFGTPSATGERSVQYIQRKLIQAGRDEEILDSLADVVAPGYWRYRIQLEKHYLRSMGAQ